MNSITPSSLREKINNKDYLLLIDVREPFEHATFNIGGILIPMSQLVDRIAEIPTDKKVIFYCEKGIRSVIAIQRLQQRKPFTNLFNLTGGMQQWLKESASPGI